MALLPIRRREMPINDAARVQSELQDMTATRVGSLRIEKQGFAYGEEPAHVAEYIRRKTQGPSEDWDIVGFGGQATPPLGSIASRGLRTEKHGFLHGFDRSGGRVAKDIHACDGQRGGDGLGAVG
jgi:hypothetical protein